MLSGPRRDEARIAGCRGAPSPQQRMEDGVRPPAPVPVHGHDAPDVPLDGKVVQADALHVLSSMMAVHTARPGTAQRRAPPGGPRSPPGRSAVAEEVPSCLEID